MIFGQLLRPNESKPIGYEVLFGGDDVAQRLTVEQYNLLSEDEKTLITQKKPIYSEKH